MELWSLKSAQSIVRRLTCLQWKRIWTHRWYLFLQRKLFFDNVVIFFALIFIYEKLTSSKFHLVGQRELHHSDTDRIVATVAKIHRGDEQRAFSSLDFTQCRNSISIYILTWLYSPLNLIESGDGIADMKAILNACWFLTLLSALIKKHSHNNKVI